MKDAQTILAFGLVGVLMSSPSIGPIVEQMASPIIGRIELTEPSRDDHTICATLTVDKRRAARTELVHWTLTGSEDRDPAFVSAYLASTGKVLRADPPLSPGAASARLCWHLAAADWLRDDRTLTLTGTVTYDGWLYWQMPYRIGPVHFERGA